MSNTLSPETILSNGIITQTYQDHRDRDSYGIDIDAPDLPEGSEVPVMSPVDGTVTISGGRWGTVEIEDAKGYRHRILHLASVAVNVGEVVSRGQVIGTLGSTVPDGRPPVRDHVHYQLKNPTGEHVNPETHDYSQEA